MTKEESLNLLELERHVKEVITPEMKQLFDIVEDNMKFNRLTYEQFTQDLASEFEAITKDTTDNLTKEERKSLVDTIINNLINKYGRRSNEKAGCEDNRED